MDKKTQQKVIDKLNEIGANSNCQACGHDESTIVGDFYKLLSTSSFQGDNPVNFNNTPCAVITCDKCGLLKFHAIGMLFDFDDFS